MTDLLVLSLSFFGLFLASVGISYALAWWLRKQRRVIAPGEGASLKISSGGQLYRTRFLGVTPEGWAFQPPLEGGVPIPFRVGDPLKVEATCSGGVMHFRSILVWRSAEPFMMIMRPPADATLSDRRTTPRIKTQAEVVLDGARAVMVDVGEWGARLVTDATVRRGERVNVESSVLSAPVSGHVLDVFPAQGRPFSREVRLVFEEQAVLA